jgi:hypothetical protein
MAALCQKISDCRRRRHTTRDCFFQPRKSWIWLSRPKEAQPVSEQNSGCRCIDSELGRMQLVIQ